MKNTYPSYFNEFRCIADKCPDTCCAGWDIVVDEESLEKYNSMQSGYGEKIRSLMTVDSDGDTVYKSVSGRCPFLLKNGLCDMFIAVGHDNLCRTCRQFPRHITDFGSRIETGLSFSCPEAARLITESDAPITFETEEIEGNISPNSIDPDIYFTLLRARNLAIDILQNRKYSVTERLSAFLVFAERINGFIRKDLIDEAIGFIQNYSFALPHSSPRSASAKKALKKYFSDFVSLEKLNSDWVGYSEEISEVFCKEIAEFIYTAKADEYELEHFAVYLVFRYFLTAVFDYDLLTKAKFTVLSLINICRIQAFANASDKQSRVEIMQKYSKEVEHSANNLETLNLLIKQSKYYSVGNLINILEMIK